MGCLTKLREGAERWRGTCHDTCTEAVALGPILTASPFVQLYIPICSDICSGKTF